MWYAYLLVSYVVCLTSVKAELVLKNNGYEGVVVAIHNSIEEDLNLLQNIKEVFRSASKFLYKATNERAFFRSVTIALPTHWSDQDGYVRTTGNHFPGAHVRVDAPNPEYLNEPYTLQPGGCGEPGRFIHLTADYLRSLYKYKDVEDERPGKRLVHEWAHLRYGVFDENGYPNDPKYPVFFRNGRAGVLTNACVQSIRGSMSTLDGAPCDITEGNEINLKDCAFHPFDDNEVKASLMFKSYVPSIIKFCDETSHNDIAPNKHNEMCKSESVWTVIQRHEDFKSKNPSVNLKEEETEPEFRIVKAKKDDRGRYVLVLDVSGSMRGKPIWLLKEAATRLISDVVPDGAFLGLVSFRDEARILSPLVQVSNLTRKILVSKLPVNADGKTAIGVGLHRAIQALEGGGNVTEGAVVVLLSDGEENVAPFMSEVAPHIQNKKIMVNCIAFGSDASRKLEKLAKSTGGKTFLVEDISGNKPITVLDSAFRDSVLTTMDEEKQPVLIAQEDLDLNAQEREIEIDLDPQLGLNTVFSLDVAGGNSVDMTVSSPGGAVFGPGNGETIYSADDDRVKVTLPGEAEAGKYNVKLTNKWDNDISASLSVTSETRDPDDPPIRVKSWLSDIQVQYPGRIRVFVEVKRGYDPVIGATVTATVRQTSTPFEEVVLHDNGIGPDVTEDDGIYSAFLTHFNGDGRYGVVSKVTNTGNARMKFASNLGGNDTNKRSRKVREVTHHNDTDQDGTPFLISPFQRTAEAGTFLVENWKPDVSNEFPPDKVRDLKVMEQKVDSSQHKFVTLAWTSPIQEMDQDIKADLRVSCGRETILKQFEEAFVLNDTWVVNGSLLAAAPQERQAVTIKIPASLSEDLKCVSGSTEIYYFALTLYNSNIKSDISVVAEAHFFKHTPIHQTQSLTFWFIVGGGILIAVILIAVFISLMKIKKHRKVEPCDDKMYF